MASFGPNLPQAFAYFFSAAGGGSVFVIQSALAIEDGSAA
jgi:hypothetical protein